MPVKAFAHWAMTRPHETNNTKLLAVTYVSVMDSDIGNLNGPSFTMDIVIDPDDTFTVNETDIRTAVRDQMENEYAITFGLLDTVLVR